MKCEQCGIKLTGNKKRFCSKECSNKWWDFNRRLNKGLRCGYCNKKLTGCQQKWCSKSCKQKAEYYRIKEYKAKWGGIILKYRKCSNRACGKQFAVFKSSPNAKSCCKSCGATARYQDKLDKHPQRLKSVTKKESKKTITKRKLTYCIQNDRQCSEYDKGFCLENIDAGCWGMNHTGNCYVAPNTNTLTCR